MFYVFTVMSDEEKMIISMTSWIDCIPKIPYVESDDTPIPETESIWLNKAINRAALTRFVRYWTRKKVNVENIACLTKRDTRETAKELGLTREQTKARIKAQEFTLIWNAAAIKFQQKLFEHEHHGFKHQRRAFEDILWYKNELERDVPRLESLKDI